MAKQPLIPEFGKKVRLKDYDPGYTENFKRSEGVEAALQQDLQKLADLQDRLYAEHKRALLIVLQGIDTGGKDGTIKHVFRGVNPQGVEVTALKVPTEEELSHDFLWRIHQRTPKQGHIGVFNRSHYEDVIVVRVHDLVPKKVWKGRYAHINNFEKLLTEENTVVLKFFLYISKQEQRKRLEARLEDPTKNWKFQPGDLDERKLWDEYTAAYESMLTQCNTEYAPWYIVPGNHKWYRNYVVSKVIVEVLEKMNPTYPKPKEDLSKIKIPD